jgi:hypothetical protein
MRETEAPPSLSPAMLRALARWLLEQEQRNEQLREGRQLENTGFRSQRRDPRGAP